MTMKLWITFTILSLGALVKADAGYNDVGGTPALAYGLPGGSSVGDELVQPTQVEPQEKVRYQTLHQGSGKVVRRIVESVRHEPSRVVNKVVHEHVKVPYPVERTVRVPYNVYKNVPYNVEKVQRVPYNVEKIVRVPYQVVKTEQYPVHVKVPVRIVQRVEVSKPYPVYRDQQVPVVTYFVEKVQPGANQQTTQSFPDFTQSNTYQEQPQPFVDSYNGGGGSGNNFHDSISNAVSENQGWQLKKW